MTSGDLDHKLLMSSFFLVYAHERGWSLEVCESARAVSDLSLGRRDAEGWEIMSYFDLIVHLFVSVPHGEWIYLLSLWTDHELAFVSNVFAQNLEMSTCFWGCTFVPCHFQDNMLGWTCRS